MSCSRLFPLACALLFAAIAPSQQTPSTANSARDLIDQGDGLKTKGKYDEAVARYELARRVAEDSGDRASVGKALGSIGVIHLFRGEYKQALDSFERSLPAYKDAGDMAGMARALNNIGTVHLNTGERQTAVRFYQDSLDVAEKAGAQREIANAASNLAGMREDEGDFAAALEGYNRSLKINEVLGERAGIAGDLDNIGNIHQRRGEYVDAFDVYERALKIKEEIGDPHELALTLNNIGVVQIKLGRLAAALETLLKSVELSRQLQDRAMQARTLGLIGRIHEANADFRSALTYFNRALQLAQALGAPDAHAAALNDIGGVHAELGDYNLALTFYLRALKIARATGDKQGISAYLANTANAYGNLGRFADAIARLRESVDIDESMGNKRGLAGALYNLGLMELRSGAKERGLNAIERSIRLEEELGEQARMAMALVARAEILRGQRRHDEAAASAARALGLARQAGEPLPLFEALSENGAAQGDLKNYREARQSLEEAISLIERTRDQIPGAEQTRQRFFENRVDPYRLLVQTALFEDDTSEAFLWAERSRARVLLDVLASGPVDLGPSMTAEERRREQEFEERLRSLNAQTQAEAALPRPDSQRGAQLARNLDQARSGLEAFRASLYVEHPELQLKRGRVEPITLNDTVALLPDRSTAILEFVVMESVTVVFAVDRSGVLVYDIPRPAAALKQQVERFRGQLAQKDMDYQKAAGNLYRLLVAPAAAKLRGKTTLILSPDGPLWELPFQALMTGERHLAEQCAISYAPSMTALREMRKLRNRAGPRHRLLAISSELRDAEDEVRAIADLYGSGSRVLSGPQASERSFKSEAGNYAVVHVATHGFLDNERPMYSYVSLGRSRTAGEDGRLEAREIAQLTLKADLVVLSACETARGRSGAGEGIVGLSWAFFLARARSTVVSLWKVDSAATAGLMVAFHKELLKPNASAAKALQAGALQLLKDTRYSHPFYWAPFVVVGDPYPPK